MPIDKTKLTKEMLMQAAQCETAEDLIALAKKAGCEITKAEAEACYGVGGCGNKCGTWN